MARPMIGCACGAGCGGVMPTAMVGPMAGIAGWGAAAGTTMGWGTAGCTGATGCGATGCTGAGPGGWTSVEETDGAPAAPALAALASATMRAMSAWLPPNIMVLASP